MLCLENPRLFFAENPCNKASTKKKHAKNRRGLEGNHAEKLLMLRSEILAFNLAVDPILYDGVFAPSFRWVIVVSPRRIF